MTSCRSIRWSTRRQLCTCLAYPVEECPPCAPSRVSNDDSSLFGPKTSFFLAVPPSSLTSLFIVPSSSTFPSRLPSGCLLPIPTGLPRPPGMVAFSPSSSPASGLPVKSDEAICRCWLSGGVELARLVVVVRPPSSGDAGASSSSKMPFSSPMSESDNMSSSSLL